MGRGEGRELLPTVHCSEALRWFSPVSFDYLAVPSMAPQGKRERVRGCGSGGLGFCGS